MKPNNLKESEALMSFVLAQALELKVDNVEILGDLFDTHSILRLEVLEFWDRWFDILPDHNFNTTVLVGNHDQSGSYTDDFSGLHLFQKPERKNFRVVVSSYIDGKIGYLPYIHNNEKFIESANFLASEGATVLVSHTTYQGSKYDNGMFAPDGVDPDLLDKRFLHLISGHVHSEQEFGRVWYPGTARWMSKSCANRRKGIWLVEHDDNTGAILSKQFISTGSVCTPIISLVWKEGQEKPEIPQNAKVDIELHGSSDWVTKTKKDLVGSVSVSSKITDIKKSKERKSGRSLHDFLSNYYQSDKKEKLINYMKGLDLLG